MFSLITIKIKFKFFFKLELELVKFFWFYHYFNFFSNKLINYLIVLIFKMMQKFKVTFFFATKKEITQNTFYFKTFS